MVLTDAHEGLSYASFHVGRVEAEGIQVRGVIEEQPSDCPVTGAVTWLIEIETWAGASDEAGA